MNNPITPDTLYPVYIAISVNIGCMPIWIPTIFGSTNCLTIDIIIHSTKMLTPSLTSPLHADIIAHGTITVPEPNIGRASTNPIANAYNKGYFTSSPAILKAYSPISDITKEISISVASAFRYFPNTFTSSFKCLYFFLSYVSCRCCYY